MARGDPVAPAAAAAIDAPVPIARIERRRILRPPPIHVLVGARSAPPLRGRDAPGRGQRGVRRFRRGERHRPRQRIRLPDVAGRAHGGGDVRIDRRFQVRDTCGRGRGLPGGADRGRDGARGRGFGGRVHAGGGRRRCTRRCTSPSCRSC